jgi:hypothetical protein
LLSSARAHTGQTKIKIINAVKTRTRSNTYKLYHISIQMRAVRAQRTAADLGGFGGMLVRPRFTHVPLPNSNSLATLELGASSPILGGLNTITIRQTFLTGFVEVICKNIDGVRGHA